MRGQGGRGVQSPAKTRVLLLEGYRVRPFPFLYACTAKGYGMNRCWICSRVHEKATPDLERCWIAMSAS